MTPERWKQIEEVFQTALEREPNQRAAFLDTVCDGDKELQREVESLLAADQQANSSFIAPLTNETKSVSTSPQQIQNHYAGLYCPKCGASNNEKVKYCRGCGENLKVVAQAMKQTLPVMLASKFDEIVENKSEGFRRDSILDFLAGILFLMPVVSQFIFEAGWTLNVLYWLTLSLLMFVGGIWDMLAYKRSRELSSTATKRKFPLETIYCPRCAEANKFDAQFCRKCGEDMKAVVRAVTQRLPVAITNLLDRYIAWEYRWIFQRKKLNQSWFIMQF